MPIGLLFLKNRKWEIHILLIHYHIMTYLSLSKVISEAKQICFASDFSKSS